MTRSSLTVTTDHQLWMFQVLNVPSNVSCHALHIQLPKKDSFTHLATSTKFCNYYSAQIPGDFNKYMYRLGRNCTIAALAKQIMLTAAFCSSSSFPQRAGRPRRNAALSPAVPASNASEQSAPPIINLCFGKDCFITVSTREQTDLNLEPGDSCFPHGNLFADVRPEKRDRSDRRLLRQLRIALGMSLDL